MRCTNNCSISAAFCCPDLGPSTRFKADLTTKLSDIKYLMQASDTAADFTILHPAAAKPAAWILER
jgi:hypothetical protein